MRNAGRERQRDASSLLQTRRTERTVNHGRVKTSNKGKFKASGPLMGYASQTNSQAECSFSSGLTACQSLAIALLSDCTTPRKEEWEAD